LKSPAVSGKEEIMASEAEVKKAEDHKATGNTLFGQEKWKNAADEYSLAIELVESARIERAKVSREGKESFFSTNAIAEGLLTKPQCSCAAAMPSCSCMLDEKFRKKITDENVCHAVQDISI